MAPTRRSQRKADGSSQGSPDATAGSKRKADTTTASAPKRGKNATAKGQKTLEETMPDENQQNESKDEDMKEGEDVLEQVETGTKDLGPEDNMNTEEEKPAKETGNEEQAPQEEATAANGHSSKMDDTGKIEPKDAKDKKDAAGGTAEGVSKSSSDDAVEKDSKREESTPSSILEKGLIYFFFRGRVNVEDPSNVNDLARSCIVLRPLPHGAKLGDGPIGDGGNNRMLALPKKVLPVSPKDRFMVFVDKANASMEDIKTLLSSSDYATQTAGTRHTPAATPIGEGVYAITTTGRESHLAYILTTPDLGEVQKEVGLRERGSFVTSVKNPSYEGPANTNLPQGPGYPQEILDEFRSLRWMPLQPKLLDYENTQTLLIGSGADDLSKATAQQSSSNDADKPEKDTPLEEMEKLEAEDEARVEHLKGDDSVFMDLGLNAKDYPKMQTTW